MREILLLLLAFSTFPLRGDDLTVGWISRQPEIDYVWDSTDPQREGWPADGSDVIWRGHVFGPQFGTATYEWLLDGALVDSGVLLFSASGQASADLRLPWRFERQELELRLDPADAIDETSEANNHLKVFTDALSVGIWVEQSFYDFLNENQYRLGVGSVRFENWFQRSIARFNESARLAVYEATPHGVFDRLRLQKITIVPDGALPLVPVPGLEELDGEPNGSTHPDMSDRSVDLQWGFTSDRLSSFRDLSSVSLFNSFYAARVTFHELGHARYLTDVYGWDVRSDLWANIISIRENGKKIAGTALMPSPAPGIVHRTSERGLMNHQHSFIDRYSAVALNQIAGHRATRGNYNEPENIASFLNDLPAQNHLLIRDWSGRPLSDSPVSIYQAVAIPGSGRWYARSYDAHPDIELRTDVEGRVTVGRSPFSPDGTLFHTFEGSNIVAIIRAERDGEPLYGFLESRLFNLAYWMGQVDEAEHVVHVGPSPCGQREPELTAPAYERAVAGPTARLTWTAVDGTTSYEVWVATGEGKPELVRTTSQTSIYLVGTERTFWWVVARFDRCPSIRSETGTFQFVQPGGRRRLVNRR